jgi:hypothetical protein
MSDRNCPGFSGTVTCERRCGRGAVVEGRKINFNGYNR